MNKNIKIKENSLILIDRLLLDLTKDNTLITDRNLMRRQRQYISELKYIRNLVKTDPRFPYQLIQNQIDFQLRTDNSLKVFNVYLHLEGLISNHFFNPIVYGGK